MAELVIHVGYPKTATTTFQRYVYPWHPDIDYLGKLIPGFGYVDNKLTLEIDALLRENDTRYRGPDQLRTLLDHYLEQSSRKIVLISSESLVDGWACDRGLVARRLRQAGGNCKVVFSLREQISAIKSFYSAHGRFGHNLFLSKTELEPAGFPMDIDTWLEFCFRMLDKNFPGILLYDQVIKYYEELFGVDNVGVFLFEEFCRDRSSYIKKFSEFVGIDFACMEQLVADNHENPNLSTLELLFYRLCLTLRIQPDINRLQGKAAMYIKALSGKFGSAPVKMNDTWEYRLQQLYAPGNQELMRRRGLPLDEYNYYL